MEALLQAPAGRGRRLAASAYEGRLRVVVALLVLVTLPFVGWTGPTWLVVLLYVLGAAGVVTYARAEQPPYTGPTSDVIGIVNTTLLVGLTGWRDSPYVGLYILMTLLVATHRPRPAFVRVSVLAVLAFVGIHLYPDVATAQEFKSLGMLLVFVVGAGAVINDVVGEVNVASVETLSLRSALDELVEPVAMYDQGSERLLYANGAIAALLGLESPEELIGQPVTALGGLRDLARMPGVSREAARKGSGEVVRVPVSWPMAGGDSRDLEVMLQSVQVADRSVIVTVVHDVTSLKHALRVDREAIQRLRAVDALKDSFLGAVSHELRTPLTVVRGMAATLAANADRLTPTQIADMADRLDHHAARLSALLCDLLDVDRLRSGSPRPRRTSINPREVIGRVVRSIDARQRVSVAVRAEAAELEADQFERCLAHLVANAIKYTQGPVEVMVEPHGGGGLHLAVSDVGDGIPDVHKAKVFEPFVRLHEADPSPGTGIGLALVAKFAEHHGGRAWVDDREGGGSVVHVLLPGPGMEEDPVRAISLDGVVA